MSSVEPMIEKNRQDIFFRTLMANNEDVTLERSISGGSESRSGRALKEKSKRAILINKKDDIKIAVQENASLFQIEKSIYMEDFIKLYDFIIQNIESHFLKEHPKSSGLLGILQSLLLGPIIANINDGGLDPVNFDLQTLIKKLDLYIAEWGQSNSKLDDYREIFNVFQEQQKINPIYIKFVDNLVSSYEKLVLINKSGKQILVTLNQERDQKDTGKYNQVMLSLGYMPLDKMFLAQLFPNDSSNTEKLTEYMETIIVGYHKVMESSDKTIRKGDSISRKNIQAPCFVSVDFATEFNKLTIGRKIKSPSKKNRKHWEKYIQETIKRIEMGSPDGNSKMSISSQSQVEGIHAKEPTKHESSTSTAPPKNTTDSFTKSIQGDSYRFFRPDYEVVQKGKEVEVMKCCNSNGKGDGKPIGFIGLT